MLPFFGEGHKGCESSAHRIILFPFSSPQCANDAADRCSLKLSGQRTFPNSDHVPSIGAKGAGHSAVTGFVAREFWPPIFAPGVRNAAVARASVPETSINEERKFRRAKNEIRFSQKRLCPPPSAHPMRPEKGNHAQLGVKIAPRPNAKHHD